MTIDKDKYSKYLTAASNSFLSKGWIYLLLVGGLYILYKAIFRTSLPNFLAFSMLPLVTAAFLLILNILNKVSTPCLSCNSFWSQRL